MLVKLIQRKILLANKVWFLMCFFIKMVKLVHLNLDNDELETTQLPKIQEEEDLDSLEEDFYKASSLMDWIEAEFSHERGIGES